MRDLRVRHEALGEHVLLYRGLSLRVVQELHGKRLGDIRNLIILELRRKNLNINGGSVLN